jgi:alpha-L-arabinofuranosidase
MNRGAAGEISLPRNMRSNSDATPRGCLSYGGHLSLVASGPSDDDWDWTHDFFEEIARKGAGQIERIYGLALHHYAWNLSRGRTQDWVAGKGDALQFEAIDWYELLKQGDQMEALVNGHWQSMEQFDHDHHVKLVVDEMGPWLPSRQRSHAQRPARANSDEFVVRSHHYG